jgi:hypothetical protein
VVSQEENRPSADTQYSQRHNVLWRFPALETWDRASILILEGLAVVAGGGLEEVVGLVVDGFWG